MSSCAQDWSAGAWAFTEHLDLTGWVIDQDDILDHLRPLLGDDGLLTPDPLDVGGYLDSIDRCRRQFPGLRILSGVEFGLATHRRGEGAAASTSRHWIA